MECIQSSHNIPQINVNIYMLKAEYIKTTSKKSISAHNNAILFNVVHFMKKALTDLGVEA